MKLFVFEPCKWDYCGGAIGVIAKDFERAVELIIANGEAEKAKNEYFSNPYKLEYFSETENKFKEGSFNQWLLTNTMEVTDDNERVVFDNWNYA